MKMLTELTKWFAQLNLQQSFTNEYKVAQLSQRDRDAGWVSFSGRRYSANIIGLPSTTVT